jgi:hypothetical protein
MATRLYLHGDSDETMPVPASYSSGWNKTKTIFDNSILAPAKVALSVSVGFGQNALSGTSGHYTANGCWVYGPLAAQTISGTLSGKISCYQINSTDNVTLAVAAKVIKPDGTDRGQLLQPVAPDDLTYEMVAGSDTAADFRELRDASENLNITLSSLVVSDGDYLVVEIGFLQQSTSTATVRTGSGIYYIADDATQFTDPAFYANSYVEFSQDLKTTFIGRGEFVPVPFDAQISDATPTNATSTITLGNGAGVGNRPAIRKGDLVVVFCQSRNSATWSVGVDGGQTWTAETAVAVTSNVFVRVFWCTFNGTWSADPRFDSTSSTCTSAYMQTYRGKTINDVWAIDVAQAASNSASAATHTVPAVTTVADNVVVLGAFFSADDNGWLASHGGGNWKSILQNNGGWFFRNNAGQDQSAVFHNQIVPAGGTSTGNLSRTINVNGNDAATLYSIAFKNIPPAEAGFAGTGSFTASATVEAGASNIKQGAASFTGEGTLAATGSVVQYGAAAFAGSGALGTDARTLSSGSSAFSGDGVLGTDAVISATAQNGAAAFDGLGALGTDARTFADGASSFNGAGALTSDAAVLLQGSSLLDGAGALSTDAWGLLLAASALDGAGTLVADARTFGDGAVSFTGTSSLSVNADEFISLAPVGDVADGTWTTHLSGSDLWTAIDELDVDDADYIRSASAPVNDTCEVSFETPLVDVGEIVVVDYRYAKSGTSQIDLTVKLKQGLTVIAEWTHTNVAESFVTASQELSEVQTSNITAYDDLSLEFVANAA